MSTVKITDLPVLNYLQANTAQTLFLGVDVPSYATYQFTATTLATGLYSNNILNVGVNQQNLPNTIAQFSLSGQSYIQTNLVNTNDGGSADIVVTANVGSGGTDSTNFIDMGYANKLYQPGQEFNNIGTAVNPLDGYLYVQGTTGSNGGNLIVGTTTTNTALKFIVGGGTASNVVASSNATNFTINNILDLNNLIVFGDGTTQNTAANPASYSTAAFNQANVTAGGLVSANANIAFLQSINNAQNTTIQNAYDKANLAGSIANTALQNTSTITVNNNLTVPGILTTSNVVASNGIIQFNNSNFQQNTTFVQITASNNFTTFAPSNTNYMLQVTGKANAVTRVVIDSFGQNTYPTLIGRMGRGSAASPAATQNNDVMMRIVGNGYTSTQFPASSPTKIDFVASENFSDTNRGTAIQFWNTPNGSNTIQKIATFNADSVSFTGYIIPQKGFVYTPLAYPSAQTAITIDMANNSLVRAQTATGLAVTLSNLTAGKEVVAWITNTAGTNQTFTHGVSATNSTTNSTTYAIPGTSTIMARYMSIDGTLSNTFVAVVHA